MSDLQQLARDFMAAIAANDPAQFDAVLHDDAGLRFYRWDGSEMYRPRQRVVQRLMDEWSAWPDPSLETFTILADETKIAIEFRVQATEHDRYVEHNRSAVLTIKDNKVHVIDLYCPEPLPSARRKNWIAPANLTDEELNRLFDSMHNGDAREYLYPDGGGTRSLRGGRWGGGEPHPGSNGVGGVRWTADEADERIEATIEYHRQRNCGFQWMVGPFDTPTDLRERLERHGLVYAGDAATMAHTHLDQLDNIPVNPDVQIEIMDGYDETAIDAMLDIMITCFNMPPEETARQRSIWVERMRDSVQSQRNTHYLARLHGQPAGFARLSLNAGVACLIAGSTLPQFRGQRVYSTLLRRRLADAHDKDYYIAAIQAEPLSRPIVTKYGFKEYARSYIYGWMPVIDVDVIKSLVPQ